MSGGVQSHVEGMGPLSLFHWVPDMAIPHLKDPLVQQFQTFRAGGIIVGAPF